MELGSGFAYVGQQYRLQVGEQEFFADLLFYHLKLRLTNDFGLNQSSIADVFGEGELTPKALENLINYTKEKNVKVIFSESTASVKDAETLAKGAGATVEKIYSLETKEDDFCFICATVSMACCSVGLGAGF